MDDKWTAVEVKDVLNECHNERHLRGATVGTVAKKPTESVSE